MIELIGATALVTVFFFIGSVGVVFGAILALAAIESELPWMTRKSRVFYCLLGLLMCYLGGACLVNLLTNLERIFS